LEAAIAHHHDEESTREVHVYHHQDTAEIAGQGLHSLAQLATILSAMERCGA